MCGHILLLHDKNDGDLIPDNRHIYSALEAIFDLLSLFLYV